MSVLEPSDGTRNLVERAKNILLKPDETWDVIDAEPATIPGIYKGYLIPLAAIPAICALIGGVVFGHSMLGVTVRTGLVSGLVSAVVGYLISLAMVYVLALIIDFLAPNFGGTRDKTQAFKVAAYSYTAGWVAGILMIFPPIGVIGSLLGFYSLYLLYKGLPKLMRTAEDKALPYVVVVVVAALILSFVTVAVTGAVASLGVLGGGALADRGAMSGTVSIPGGASVDLGKLEAASKQMEQAAKQMEHGGGDVKPADPEVLKALLPGAVEGYGRSEISSGSGGAGGMQGSTAEAVYTKGDSRLTLTITDLGAAGALAGMASAFNVKSSSEADGRYEKVGKVDGRMTTESFDRNTGHGEYGILVSDRFMIQAEGQGVTIGDLKAAVVMVQPSRLEQLAKAG